MADLKLTADDRDILAALDKVEQKLKETGQVANVTQKAVSETFSETAADAERVAAATEEYRKSQEKLGATVQERIAKHQAYRKELEAHRATQAALAKQQAEAAKLNVEHAKTIGLNTGALKDNAAAAGSAGKAVGGLAGFAGGFLRLLGPIGIAIGVVIGFLNKFQAGMDFVGRITSSVSAVFTVLIDRVVKLGTSFKDFLSGNFRASAAAFSEAVTGITDAVTDAATKAYDLEARLQALRDAQLAASVSTAKLAAESERLQAISEQESKTFGERINALRRATALEAEVAKIRVDFAKQDAALAREQYELSSKGVSDKEALIAKEIAAVEAVSAADKKRIDLLGQLNALEKQRAEFITKNINDAQAALAKIKTDTQTDPLEQELAKTAAKYENLLKLSKDAIEKIDAVEKERGLTPDEVKLKEQLAAQEVDIEKAKYAEIQKVIGDFVEKEAEFNEAAAKKNFEQAKKIADDTLELQKAQIASLEQVYKNQIALLESHGAKKEEVAQAELEADRTIKGMQLQAELEYQQKILELADITDEVQRDLVKERIRQIEIELAGLNIDPPKPQKPFNFTAWLLSGIGIGDPAQQKAIDDAFKSIIDSFGELTQARINEAQAAVKAADEKVDAAQKALDKEEELAREGLANNADVLRAQYEEAKKQRDAAYKEEQKARKEQIALDTVTQVSGLITSSVNIFKSLSNIPFVGIPLAIATIGLMIGAFAKTKADAYKLANAPKLRKGIKFDGPTHEQGGEDLAFDGRKVYKVEKGEHLIGTQHSKEHDTFLTRLNRGDYKGVNLVDALASARSDPHHSPLTESAPRIIRIQAEKSRLEQAAHYSILARAYNESADRIIGEMRSRPTVLPWKDGYKLVKDTGAGTETKTVLPAE